MTAHGSKGLEFEYVFFMGCNATYWEKRENRAGYTMPDTLFASQPVTSDEEELRRLLTYAKSF